MGHYTVPVSLLILNVLVYSEYKLMQNDRAVWCTAVQHSSLVHCSQVTINDSSDILRLHKQEEQTTTQPVRMSSFYGDQKCSVLKPLQTSL